MYIYLSPTALFMEAGSVTCVANRTEATSRAPYTYLCPATISNARYVTVARMMDSNGPFLFNELQPLRYGAQQEEEGSGRDVACMHACRHIHPIVQRAKGGVSRFLPKGFAEWLRPSSPST